MPISKKRLEEIQAIPDEDIDTSDIPELDERFWEKARLVMPRTKKCVSLRLDSDVLEWFESLGKGYQTRINAVLRSYMKAQKKKRS